MLTDNKPNYKGILGIDERIPQVENGSSELVNWTVDPRTKGWDNRIGYESLIPDVATAGWRTFQNGGPVNSVYAWNTHQGAKSWLLWEQAYASPTLKTFPTDANANMSLFYYKGATRSKVTIDATRSAPAVDEIFTHYNPIGKNLVILSGNGKPLKFDGIKTVGLGFMEYPNPPLPWGINADGTAGVSDSTAMPVEPHSFHLDQSYGLGSTTASAPNRYRWKVSFVSPDGSESPLSAPSPAVYWTTATAISATYNNKRQVAFMENVPLGPEGTVARKLYRTKNLGDGSDEEIYYYLDTIVNNYETNYCDYTKDTRLGAVAPDDDASILFPAPSTRLSATFKNCLFIDGGQTDPTRIYFSQPLKADQYRALDFFDVGSRDGGDVTGLFTYYNNLLVFRERAIDVIKGDSINGFTISPLVQGIGTRAMHSIALIPTVGVMFLSPDGVFVISGGFDGGSVIEVQKVSEPIVNTVQRMNKSMIARACGAYSEKWREYHVYFAADGASVNTLGLVFHMEKMSWSKREGFPVSSITVDNRGEFIFGHNVGQTVGAPLGTSGMRPDDTGLFFISRARLSSTTNVFTAGPIGEAGSYAITNAGALKSRWISANQDFGIDVLKKHVKQVYLHCMTEGSNTYQVFYNKDYDYNYTTSNDGLAQRSEYAEQFIYDASTNELVYGPVTATGQTVPKWELPFFTQLKFPIANHGASTFSVGIETSNDLILIEYTLEFNASNTETKSATKKSVY